MAKILKDEGFDALKSDNDLMNKVAKELNIAWTTMPMMIQRKSRRFTEFPALKLIADFLHAEMDDLLIDDAKIEEESASSISPKKVVP